MTYFYKFVFPYLFVSIFLIGAFAAIFIGDAKFYDSIFSFGIFLILTAIILKLSVSLKKIEIDDEYLYVSNFKDEVAIPLKQIESIHQKIFRFLNPELVRIKLKVETKFGNEILFTPKFRAFNITTHPVILEVRMIIGQL